jgi:hypothetical protein
VKGLEKLAPFFVGVIEPTTAPDTMEPPASTFKVLLAGAISGTGGDGRMIGSAVALNG